MSSNNLLISASGAKLSSVPKIKNIKPFGAAILVEVLTDQELTSSSIVVKGNAQGTGPAQAYVLAIGSAVDASVPLAVGDRVVLQGMANNVPKYDDSPRTKLLVELHNIKGVVEEA